MNLILFERSEINGSLARDDLRSIHLLQTLRRAVGDTFDAGIIDGRRGKGTIIAIGNTSISLSFSFSGVVPELPPLSLIVGLPRPQTARKILPEATALGGSTIHFFSA
ncbi:MAG: hypothetical protein WD490_01445 [Opitutales bacterium]